MTFFKIRCGVGRIRTCTTAFRGASSATCVARPLSAHLFVCVYHSATTPFAGLSRPSSCCEPHGGLQGIITLIAYAHWRRANLCQAPKPQNTLLSKTPIMNTTGFGRSHFNPTPSVFSAFRSASTSSRLNNIAEFLAAPAFIPRIFFRLI